MIHLPKHLSPHEHVTPALINAMLGELHRLKNIAAAPPVRISQNAAGIEIGLARELPQFDLIELSVAISPGDKNQTVKQLCYRPDDDPPALFGVGPDERELQNAADPQQGLYLQGERHLAYFHPGAGQRIPLPGVLFHLGKLTEAIAPPDPDTPDALTTGNANVWRYNADTDEYETALNGEGEQLAVDAYDWTHAGLAPGWVLLFQHNQSRHWVAIPLALNIYNTATPTGTPQTLTSDEATIQLHVDTGADLSPLVPYDNAGYKFTLADGAPEGIYEIFFCLSINDGQGASANALPSDISVSSPCYGGTPCWWCDIQQLVTAVNGALSQVRYQFDLIGSAGYVLGRIYAGTPAALVVQQEKAFLQIPVSGGYTSGGLACHAFVKLSPGDEVYCTAQMGIVGDGSPTADVEFARLSIDYLGPASPPE